MSACRDTGFSSRHIEVVALQQHPNRLPADLADQLPFHRLFRDQSYGPAGRPGGRIRAHHRDDALLLRWRQLPPPQGADVRRAPRRAHRPDSAARCCARPAARIAPAPRRWGRSRRGSMRAAPTPAAPRAPAGRRPAGGPRARRHRTASTETTREVWAYLQVEEPPGFSDRLFTYSLTGRSTRRANRWPSSSL